MTKPAGPRPPGEIVAVLARLMRNVESDRKIKKARRKTILGHLSSAMHELQQEIGR